MTRYNFSDFTTTNYRALLTLAKAKYRFIKFTETAQLQQAEKVVLWRHDIDASVHRAFALAEIEAEEGVQSTFFVQLSSHFYSVFELEIKALLVRIAQLGHKIGLHFDPSIYTIENEFELEQRLKFERSVLEQLLGADVSVFSFHVPSLQTAAFVGKEYAGMLNVYCPELSEKFKYCSDSNGYWRHDRLEEVLRSDHFSRLHILTHPEYWTDQVLSPKQRIQRCVEGRAKSTLLRFDEIVRSSGRVVPDLADEERP